MKHLRYIVYWDDGEKPQKKVALWTEDKQHSVYAKEHHILPQRYASLGYIGFNNNKWILYEHYQMDTDFPRNEQEDKTLVYRALYRFPERENKSLQAELSETYRQEKHLLLYTAKQDLKKCWQAIKNNFTSRQ